MVRYLLLSVISCGVTLPAWGLTYYLSQDLGIHGVVHVCKYSNGKLYSFNATDLCPLQVEDEGPPPVLGGGYQSPGQVGFKTGEYLDGMTKVCVYNVLGHTEAIRIGSTELCPLNHNF